MEPRYTAAKRRTPLMFHQEIAANPVRRRVFGLVAASQLEFELPFPLAESKADVEVRLGQVKAEGEPLFGTDVPSAFACLRHGEAVVLDWPEARFRVSANQVIVDAADGAKALSDFLQPIWSLLLSTRGRDPLHGCVIERDTQAFAILGSSGTGKTTAGLMLLDRGWRLLSDDLLAFDSWGNVVPGPPFIRLSPDRAGPRSGAFDIDGKLRFAVPAYSEPVPLSGMLVLHEQYRSIVQLSGLAAVDALLTNVYSPVFTYPTHASRRLTLVLDLVGRIPILGAPPRSLTADQLEWMTEEVMG